MATGTRRRRSTMALVNWVVPIITPVTVSGATAGLRASTPSMAATTPAPTSAVVGALMEAT